MNDNLAGNQFVVIFVENPVTEAEFFGRVFDTAPVEIDENSRQVNTGRFLLRMIKATTEHPRSLGVHLEINVVNVNRFAEEVWNRGLKYSMRPQNMGDGTRRVGFVSPHDIKVFGVGPPKLDSTGAFPSFPHK
ncbi:hypothetical protein EDM80_08135 [bacterium]|nr:MAG: hypothetical protein EDM80_08135 [bacterium]RIK60737.1 MAG: hypothetical protein DCC64_14385 [Planctomycetota bacterium]